MLPVSPEEKPNPMQDASICSRLFWWAPPGLRQPAASGPVPDAAAPFRGCGSRVRAKERFPMAACSGLWLFTFMHWRRKWQPTPGIPWTEEPGGLPSMGSHRVRQDWSDLAAAAAAACSSWGLPTSAAGVPVCALWVRRQEGVAGRRRGSWWWGAGSPCPFSLLSPGSRRGSGSRRQGAWEPRLSRGVTASGRRTGPAHHP